MREFIYGLLIGWFLVWGYKEYDIPGLISSANDATAYATKSTSGYK